MKTTLRLALAGVLVAGAVGCQFDFANPFPASGTAGAFCMQNSDCHSNSCVLEAYTDPPYGKCS
jgi:hypothetical protein